MDSWSKFPLFPQRLLLNLSNQIEFEFDYIVMDNPRQTCCLKYSLNSLILEQIDGTYNIVKLIFVLL